MISKTRYEDMKILYFHILFLKSYFGLNKMLFFGNIYIYIYVYMCGIYAYI